MTDIICGSISATKLSGGLAGRTCVIGAVSDGCHGVADLQLQRGESLVIVVLLCSGETIDIDLAGIILHIEVPVISILYIGYLPGKLVPHVGTRRLFEELRYGDLFNNLRHVLALNMFLIYCVLDLDLPIVYIACSMKGHLVTPLEFERSEDILSFLIGKSVDIYRTRVILHLEVAVCRMAYDGDDTGELVDIGIVVRQCEEIGDGDLGILGFHGFTLLIYLHENGGSFRGAELDLGSTGICLRLIGFSRNTKGIGTERLCLRAHGKPFLGIVRDDDLIVKIGLHESLDISSGGGNRDSRSHIKDSLGKTEDDTADRLIGVAYRHHQNITRDNVGLGGYIDLRGIVSHREIIALYEEFLRAVGSIDRIRDLGGGSRLDHIVKRCDIQGETTGLGESNGRAGAGDCKIHEVGILGHYHSGQTLGRTDVLPVLAVI